VDECAQLDEFSPITDYTFKSKCATVSLYAGSEREILANVVLGSPGSSPGAPANWWHALTINVDVRMCLDMTSRGC
jgi:hypothetical protein